MKSLFAKLLHFGAAALAASGNATADTIKKESDRQTTIRGGCRHAYGAAPRAIARKSHQPERAAWIKAQTSLRAKARKARVAMLAQSSGHRIADDGTPFYRSPNRPAGVKGPAHV